ncbi:hypothetical protein [Candidatus Methanodesulfokora washburnensis]|jgi:hypothetical protein|uniref:Uncharacterized protein n=1 Tax=Candidatus Methanodesulfokora washburnensis TaxID=2478471 RepID=A0A429GC15_9CREN|nr:hypothetical protein [Candidatus Methanodesulfokores washburnensis]RSN71262.1 hypothetical protein D6D85_16285 [Candidatus Methanodesulfokores washburnensis]
MTPEELDEWLGEQFQVLSRGVTKVVGSDEIEVWMKDVLFTSHDIEKISEIMDIKMWTVESVNNKVLITITGKIREKR